MFRQKLQNRWKISMIMKNSQKVWRMMENNNNGQKIMDFQTKILHLSGLVSLELWVFVRLICSKQKKDSIKLLLPNLKNIIIEMLINNVFQTIQAHVLLNQLVLMEKLMMILCRKLWGNQNNQNNLELKIWIKKLNKNG